MNKQQAVLEVSGPNAMTTASVSRLLSVMSAGLILVFAFANSIGSSISPFQSTFAAVIAVAGLQLASAGFALGVACLRRPGGGAKAWTGAALGASIIVLEIAFIYRQLAYNFF